MNHFTTTGNKQTPSHLFFPLRTFSSKISTSNFFSKEKVFFSSEKNFFRNFKKIFSKLKNSFISLQKFPFSLQKFIFPSFKKIFLLQKVSLGLITIQRNSHPKDGPQPNNATPHPGTCATRGTPTATPHPRMGHNPEMQHRTQRDTDPLKKQD